MIGFFPLLLESAPNPMPLIALGVFLVLSLFHSVLLYQLQLHTDLPPFILPNYSSYIYLIHHLPFKSAPAQNARPVPVIIPTDNVGSLSNHNQMFSSSCVNSALMQFKSLGLFKCTSKTPGAG